MSERFAMRVRRPIVGVRLHAVPGDASTAPPRVHALLELHGNVEREQAARAAEQRAFEAVTEALQGIPALVGARLRETAAIAVELGLALAKEIVGTAVERGHVDPTETVVRCLEDATLGARGGSVRIVLAPEDHAAVTGRFASERELVLRAAGAEFTADARQPRGCVRIETDAGLSTYDPREAIARVCAAVREGVAP